MLLGGELLAAVKTIRERVASWLERDATTGVVIDLGAATYIDSSTISVLIACRQLADRMSVPFGVIKATGMVRRVLDIAGVAEYLHLDDPPTPRVRSSAASKAAPGRRRFGFRP